MLIEPHWLDRMLCNWGDADARRAAAGLGYPSECPTFRERTGSPAQSLEPTGLDRTDYSDLQQCIDALPTKLNLAIVRHYKPHLVRDLSVYFGCYVYSDVHWRRLVKDAVRELAGAMADMRATA